MKKSNTAAWYVAAAALIFLARCALPEPQSETSSKPPPAPPRVVIPELQPTVPIPPPPVKKAPSTSEQSTIARAFDQKDYNTVVEEFDKISQRYPAHLKGSNDLYYLGMANFYLAKNDVALKSFLEFQYRFPDDPRLPEVLLMTAKVFRRLDKSERALDVLRQAIHRSEDKKVRLRALEEKADLLAGRGLYLESLTVLDEAYQSFDPAQRRHIMTRIKELLLIMPPDLIARSVIPGTYHFPKQEAEKIFTFRTGAAARPMAPETSPTAIPPDLPSVEKVEDSGATSDLPTRDTRPVARIGIVAPSSGRLESYGRAVRRGVEILLDSAGRGHFPYRIETVFADEKEEDALEKLMRSRDILVIIGPLLSGTVERIMPMAEQYQLPVFSPTASSPRLEGSSDHFFRNCLTLEELGRDLARFSVEQLGLGRFVVFSPDDVYGFHYADYFEREVIELGGEIVASKSYEPGLTDFAKPIEGLKTEIGIPDPLPEQKEGGGEYDLPFDAVFLPGQAEQVGLILPQLAFHDLDLKRVAVLGGTGLNTPRFPKIGEEFAEGTIFSDGFFAGSPRLPVQRFVERYRMKFGEDPNTFAAQAYDAAAIVLQALRRGAVSRQKMLADLGTVRDFPGVTGRTTLKPGGHVEREPFFITVAKGHLVTVGTTESEAAQRAPAWRPASASDMKSPPPIP